MFHCCIATVLWGLIRSDLRKLSIASSIFPWLTSTAARLP